MDRTLMAYIPGREKNLCFFHNRHAREAEAATGDRLSCLFIILGIRGHLWRIALGYGVFSEPVLAVPSVLVAVAPAPETVSITEAGVIPVSPAPGISIESVPPASKIVRVEKLPVA
jgi:hypothetical protein